MNSEKMALVASQKSPEMYRLQNLKAYHRLGSAARQLVKAIVVEGLPVDRAIADQPNGVRIWNSQPVILCLEAYGWQPPAKPLAVPAKPYEPANHPPIPEVPCERCGDVGRHTSRHNSQLVCHACLCEAGNIWVSRMPAESEPADSPEPPSPAVSPLVSQMFPRLADVEFWAQQQQDEKDERERLIRQIEAQQNANRWRS